jgi:hypothetical protein
VANTRLPETTREANTREVNTLGRASIEIAAQLSDCLVFSVQVSVTGSHPEAISLLGRNQSSDENRDCSDH